MSGETTRPTESELRDLAARGPTVLVLEDVPWADEATLDVLRLGGRRVEAVPALVLGGVARGVRGGEHLRDAAESLVDRHDADARGDLERIAVVPGRGAGAPVPDADRDRLTWAAAARPRDRRAVDWGGVICGPRSLPVAEVTDGGAGSWRPLRVQHCVRRFTMSTV